jgi:hypothetical protein
MIFHRAGRLMTGLDQVSTRREFRNGFPSCEMSWHGVLHFLFTQPIYDDGAHNLDTPRDTSRRKMPAGSPHQNEFKNGLVKYRRVSLDHASCFVFQGPVFSFPRLHLRTFGPFSLSLSNSRTIPVYASDQDIWASIVTCLVIHCLYYSPTIPSSLIMSPSNIIVSLYFSRTYSPHPPSRSFYENNHDSTDTFLLVFRSFCAAVVVFLYGPKVAWLLRREKL